MSTTDAPEYTAARELERAQERDGENAWRAGLRALILKKLLERGASTAAEIQLEIPWLSIEAVRPRFSELLAAGQIKLTGSRANASGRGRKEKIWESVA